MKIKLVTVRLSPAEHTALQAEAVKQERSLSWLIRRAIQAVYTGIPVE